MRAKHRLTFPLLSDPGNRYARELSIVFTLPDYLRKVYEGFGISLPESNGDDSWTLPIPTRIVADSGGKIRAINADPDYTRRPEPEETVRDLRALAEPGAPQG